MSKEKVVFHKQMEYGDRVFTPGVHEFESEKEVDGFATRWVKRGCERFDAKKHKDVKKGKELSLSKPEKVEPKKADPKEEEEKKKAELKDLRKLCKDANIDSKGLSAEEMKEALSKKED